MSEIVCGCFVLKDNFEEKIDEEYKIITVDDFSKTLLDVYQQNNNTPPTMRLYIDRGYMPKEAEMKKIVSSVCKASANAEPPRGAHGHLPASGKVSEWVTCPEKEE